MTFTRLDGRLASQSKESREMKLKVCEFTSAVRFEVGEFYSCTSVCDHNCVWTFKVIGRTSKSIVIAEYMDGKLDAPKRKKIMIHMDEESLFPKGTYSMAPILRAGNKMQTPAQI